MGQDAELGLWNAHKRIAAMQAEIARLRSALLMAVTQNDCDMLMTGDELRRCRAALTPKRMNSAAPQASAGMRG